MATLVQTVKDLILELTRLQVPNSLPEKINGIEIIPGLIAANSAGGILTSREMERLIEKVAQTLKRNDASLVQSHTDKEWNWLVRTAFGPALAAIDLDHAPEENAKTVLASVRATLADHTPEVNCEHGFGCTLFGNSDIQPFQIGPVRFEPRNIWIKRKVADNDISKIAARRIQATWASRKQKKRKQSFDAMQEDGIIDAIGDCPYVCSVRTTGLADEAGRQKAQVAAHLAMSAISLRWQRPSIPLSGFRLLTDSGVRHQRSLIFVAGKRFVPGGNLVGLPHGPTIPPLEWAAELKRNEDDFTTAGEAISYFLDATGKASRPQIMNALVQSLLWFHEGCREEIDLASVVKFSASLDSLAAGGEAVGIRRLINARLGIKDDQPIRKDGPTLKAAVEEIYGKGRSRTIHGTNDKLGHDWSSTRSLAEGFARLCLITSIRWATENPKIDDPRALQK